MKKIEIKPEIVKDAIKIDGIDFENCAFISMYIDDIDIRQIEQFEDTAVYWEQLKASTSGDGEYLIFTCYCGIPEDAGCDFIKVEHTKDNVIWYLNRTTEEKYIFSKKEYLAAVSNCERMLSQGSYPLAIAVSGYPSC